MHLPNSKLTRLVDAAVEPLSLADAKGYLRVETVAEDALIADMISAARLECERIGDRSFIITTWLYTLDYFPGPADFPFSGTDDGAIVLPMPPLISLESISYIDQGNVIRALDVTSASTPIIVSPGNPGRIYPAYGTFFPITLPRPAAVEITYRAGYGPDASSVPRSVLMAIRLLVAHYHKHRTTNAEVPDAVYNLLTSALNA